MTLRVKAHKRVITSRRCQIIYANNFSPDTLWPNDAIWRYKSVCLVAQVMPCRHHDITSTHADFSLVRFPGIHPKGNFTGSAQATCLYSEFEKLYS